MKTVLFFILILFPFQLAFAKPIKTFDLIIKTSEGAHRYSLVQDSKAKKYQLKFITAKKKQAKNLTKPQAQALLQLSSRIAWQSLYRKPASIKQSCQEYARLKSESTTTKVCVQDAKSTGQTYSLIQQMHKLFQP